MPEQPPTSNAPCPDPAVSAIVTTFNEEQNIAGCIESLLWCDEILVVDSFSTDRTPEIARGYRKVRFSSAPTSVPRRRRTGRWTRWRTSGS